MKKELKYAILFPLLLLAIVCMLQYGLDALYKNRTRNKFASLLHHNTNADVMIFGSSVAYHHFDPAIIGAETGNTVYNMGWDGMYFMQYNALIKEYLAYQKNTKCIVLVCDFDNLGKPTLITRPDLFLAYLGNNNIYSALHDIEPDKMWRAKYLPGYKLTLNNKAFYRDLLFLAHDTDANGYAPVNAEWSVTTKEQQPFMVKNDDAVYDSFKATIQAITSRGIAVAIVIPPVYIDGYKIIENVEAIKKRYNALTGSQVYFFDHSADTMSQNKAYFYNYSHLNKNGATVFSHIFAKDLNTVIKK